MGGGAKGMLPPLSHNNPATVKKVDHKCTKLKGKMIISVHFILFESIGCYEPGVTRKNLK